MNGTRDILVRLRAGVGEPHGGRGASSGAGEVRSSWSVPANDSGACPPPPQVPHENAVRIAGRIPGARLHTFEGWAHAFKDAGRLAEVVTEFMCAE